MQDKDLMENELLVVKGVCDLYLHGTIESTTAEVHTAFKEALNECEVIPFKSKEDSDEK